MVCSLSILLLLRAAGFYIYFAAASFAFTYTSPLQVLVDNPWIISFDAARLVDNPGRVIVVDNPS